MAAGGVPVASSTCSLNPCLGAVLFLSFSPPLPPCTQVSLHLPRPQPLLQHPAAPVRRAGAATGAGHAHAHRWLPCPGCAPPLHVPRIVCKGCAPLRLSRPECMSRACLSSASCRNVCAASFYHTKRAGEAFVKAEVRQGVLPGILSALVAARRQAQAQPRSFQPRMQAWATARCSPQPDGRRAVGTCSRKQLPPRLAYPLAALPVSS